VSEVNRLRKIPPVSVILELGLREPWASDYSRDQLVTAIREELSHSRNRLGSGEISDIDPVDVVRRLHSRLKGLHEFSLRSVINATGIIVHTNLGRAPLAAEATKHITEIASGYSNLEFDLEKGERGSREKHVEKFLTRLFPIEAALVVNNNASALLLILNTLAEGKEVIVSRGELIEIGGSFRLPEIMKKSGAILREVGTTNKTSLSDYRSAINQNTALILSVHPSNYRIIGFTEKPCLSELALLGREFGIPVVEDEGSGIFLELEPFGISEESSVHQSFEEGIELVCFSGDKILGGPQAGIVCGKKEWIEKLRANSLFRALRVDKMVYAALEATLLLYLKGETSRIPVVSMLSVSEGELKSRAKNWLSHLRKKFPNADWQMESTTCYVGGGVAPMKGLPSIAVALSHPDFSAKVLSDRLRESDPPVVARIEEEKLFFELRTILAEEEILISAALDKILTEPPG
jgi:L-seryl-tRNA(Ser) seleniumtransferase